MSNRSEKFIIQCDKCSTLWDLRYFHYCSKCGYGTVDGRGVLDGDDSRGNEIDVDDVFDPYNTKNVVPMSTPESIYGELEGEDDMGYGW